MRNLPDLQPSNEVESTIRDRTAELVRSNELLRDENLRLHKHVNDLNLLLKTARQGSDNDRETRRAALNLMEDAVESRRELQIENHARREIEEELRLTDRRKDEFLATLAHELRTPLSPIRNGLQILRLKSSDENEYKRTLASMDRQINHIVRLVDDLLEVSRITRGKIELRTAHLELEKIVKNALEISQPAIEAAGHQLFLSLPDDPILVDGDEVRLTQVISNLVNNAAKYTHNGGQIWVTVSKTDTLATITVRDTGIGISDDMQSRVFEIFAQVDRSYSRAQGGLGIGLTLARSLIEMHGGSIVVHSDGPGHGSEFTVRLPMSSNQHCANDDAVSPDVDQLTSSILVVDDNRDAAESLSILLSHFGANVRAVHSGQAALRAVQEFRPGVVLLDIGMPGMDGFEVATRLRQQKENKGVTLIALTGWGQEADRKRTRDAGFDHHLTKPVELESLRTLLLSIHK